MRIEHPHALGRDEAARRIDHLLDRLAAQPPGGVTIGDAVKEWEGSLMRFSFTAAKGGFGTSIRGRLEVSDDRVVVEAELPPLVKAFVGEARVEKAIAGGLGDVLGR